jgi:hypothetical protein
MASENAHMQGRQAEKDMALAEIARVLDSLSRACQEPRHWERVCLVRALMATFSGCYSLAIIEARIAGAPENPNAQLPSDLFLGQCSLSRLREAYERARAQPVQPFPRLGPIEFS